jgi:O-antigen/teichoic acid export membrane protein
MRHWKAISTSFATLCARLLSVAGLMITNGIAGRLMSKEQFGLWAILLSFNLLTNGLDLGFGFTLGNRLAALGSRGSEAEQERRETFLSIFFLEALITLALILLILVFVPIIPWTYFFHITDPVLGAQAQHIMPLTLIFMVGTLPFALTGPVLYAYQEIKLASGLAGASALLQTAVFAIAVTRCSYTQLILIYFFANVALCALGTVYIFFRRNWAFSFIQPGRAVAIVRSLARVSIHAFCLCLPAIFNMMLGPLISGMVSGLAAAGDFLLVQKLFTFLGSAHLSILSPFTPKFTLDAASGAWDAVRARLRLCLLVIFPVTFGTAGLAIFLFHPFIIHLWVGRTITDYAISALFLGWIILYGFGNTYSVLLNALGLVKVQAILSMSMILPSLLLPFLLGRIYGPVGIPISAIICMLPAMIILPLYTRKALRLKLTRL